MTFDDIERKLAATTFESGGMLFAPCNSAAGPYLEANGGDVVAAWEEIKRKLLLVELGLAEFTTCERLMFHMIRNHCEVAHSLPSRKG